MGLDQEKAGLGYSPTHLNKPNNGRGSDKPDAPILKRMTAQNEDQALSPAQAQGDDAPSPFLGDRIRGLRKRRGLTLTQLAESANLSPGYISQLERNLSSPSVAALVNIAKTLGVTVQWFFSADTPQPMDERGFVVRRANRLQIQYEQGVIDELLTPRMDLQIELLYTRMPPGSESSQSYSHEGEEVGYVQSGQLEIWLGEDKHFVLSEGDTVAFSSRLPHRYRNPGSVEAIILWAISPPGF